MSIDEKYLSLMKLLREYNQKKKEFDDALHALPTFMHTMPAYNTHEFQITDLRLKLVEEIEKLFPNP